VALIAYKRLEFARQPGDYLVSGRVQLDQGGPTYRMTLRLMPQQGPRGSGGRWSFTMRTTSNLSVVTGAWVRDRTSVLLGIASPGRPRGDIISYDPKGRGDPGPDAFRDDGQGVLFIYLPGGFRPEDFSLYTTAFA
jgi:hypothetical protein